LVSATVFSILWTGVFGDLLVRSELHNIATTQVPLVAPAFSHQVAQYVADAAAVTKTSSNVPDMKEMASVSENREEIKGVPRDVDLGKRQRARLTMGNFADFAYIGQFVDLKGKADEGNTIFVEPWEEKIALQRLSHGNLEWFQSAIDKMA